MNKRQKEVVTATLHDEKAILKAIESNYTSALVEIKRNIKELQANPLTQSKTYQLDFQKQLETQISGILDSLQGKNFVSVADYLNTCYNNGFIGTMYDLQGQGVPLVLPIDQAQVLKAVQKTGDDVKLSKKLGGKISDLKKQTLAELQRGLASQLSYADIARNISDYGQANMKRSYNIARTEGHRVQNEAKMDSLTAAKAKGADIVKQWDSTLDGVTRETHQELDGQVREVDESFEVAGKSASAPGCFGDPAEDCNCRCCLLQRARWAVEGETTYQKWNNETGGFIETTGYDDFKQKYLDSSEYLKTVKQNGIVNVGDIKDFDLLADYMKKTYGVTLNDTVKGLDFTNVNESMTGIEAVMKEFPQAQSSLHTIGTSKNGVMCATLDGGINFNPAYYQNGNASVASTMVQGNKTGFHPKNTGVKEVGSHEMGHILEKALVDRQYSDSDAYSRIMRIDEWNKGVQSKSIISDACKAVKKTPEGKGLLNRQLEEQVSGYATKNKSECLDECVADYMANGENAAPLSKEVWKILKGKLG